MDYQLVSLIATKCFQTKLKFNVPIVAQICGWKKCITSSASLYILFKLMALSGVTSMLVSYDKVISWKVRQILISRKYVYCE